MKQRVYIETTVVSYLTARQSRNNAVSVHQDITRQWWAARSSAFELHVSELVLKEARGGDLVASLERLAMIEALPVLPTSDDAIELAERLVDAGSFPPNAAADALHIAIAAVNGIEFLLTWNFKHLANAIRRYKIESVIESSGFACPNICTPEELLED